MLGFYVTDQSVSGISFDIADHFSDVRFDVGDHFLTSSFEG